MWLSVVNTGAINIDYSTIRLFDESLYDLKQKLQWRLKLLNVFRLTILHNRENSNANRVDKS